MNTRPPYDQIIQDISDYVLDYEVRSQLAIDTARLCLMDSLGCAMLALRFPECCKHLGPQVTGSLVPNGARVPGTQFCLDPVKAAWDIGCLIRWLDYNDTWLAAEWGHPSDNLGALLAVADHLCQKNRQSGRAVMVMRDLFQAMVKAHEIQGVLALENAFNQVGLDHVVLVKVASAAVATTMLGGNREQVMSAVSHAWVDGQALRTYRHAPNTGSRKSWAAGDATSRAVRLAEIAMRGEMGVPGVLSTPKWGFYDVLFSQTNDDLKCKPDPARRFAVSQPYGSYVMENILFKVSYPAEFHAQTACECAQALHSEVRERLDQIDRIEVRTQQAAIRIISKQGALNNPADRDHCLEYMVAVSLLFGKLTAEHYEDEFHAHHPLIDRLRERMVVKEEVAYSRDYLDPAKRSIANAVQVFFTDGSHTDKVEIAYPLGHRKRRDEAILPLKKKFRSHLASRFPLFRVEQIEALFSDADHLDDMAVDHFLSHFVI
ncbi:bifunctional 2-methylcitrate dehydratase/aconitate hydratase [Bowmanella dokdonensis]|uniref:2-methylcitrate dehydratase n=1 Tax=Bowmanella dokdonensis TaxID=751969 RepID=A0A939DKM7_9ALTE|nr:bifunctional 2-methylcitrate dehydratase/aconitate hydratase [Bowmanella dokdonensis]MBN7824392.1 bifunctional 2-methylcitrate dehydratase/aconitate hydratase [Bowmanella dokdonensis]